MRHHAFSLTELLVVISIIAILASMLLPAISLVRTQAKKADCANRLRQMGLAFEVYIQGNEGQYPIGNTGGGNWAAWYKAITGDSTNALTVAQGLANYQISGAAEWGKQFYCSEDPCTPTTDLTPLGSGNTRIAWDLYTVSHGYNGHGLGGNKGNIFTTADYDKPAHRSSIKRPSETVLSVDNKDSMRPAFEAAGYGHGLAGANGSPGAFPRHGGRIANVLWVDGHVSGVFGKDEDALYSHTNLGINGPPNNNNASATYIDTMWDRQ